MSYADAIATSEALRLRTKPRLTRYIPNRPTKKQRLAMCLPHVREILYGGAAGGGKSDWLLMEALQYVDIPDYRAKIFRLTLADADNEDSIMFRAKEWLSGTDAISERGGQRWRFPSGATLSFGGLDKKDDHLKQQGAQFSFLGFDELTQFHSYQFEYLINSRLRKPGCSKHKETRDPDCKYCRRYMHTRLFPLRIRCATNPGGRSHSYVKERYDIGPVPGLVGPTGTQLYAGRFTKPREGKDGVMIPPRPHIPAFAHDNPFLDIEDYTRQLGQMTDPVTRAQLLAGDWGVSADGRFRRAWIRRYELRGGWMVCGQEAIEFSKCRQFVMIDPASSTEATPGKTELGKKHSSWTVISRWAITPNHNLCLLNVQRMQVEMPQIIPAIQREASGPVEFVGMEYTTQSIYLYQACRQAGLGMRPFKTQGKDKVSRAFDAANRMEQGQIWFPTTMTPWLQAFEDEVFTWTGDKEETDDQVDVLSYAAIHLSQQAGWSGEMPFLG